MIEGLGETNRLSSCHVAMQSSNNLIKDWLEIISFVRQVTRRIFIHCNKDEINLLVDSDRYVVVPASLAPGRMALGLRPDAAPVRRSLRAPSHIILTERMVNQMLHGPHVSCTSLCFVFR